MWNSLLKYSGPFKYYNAAFKKVLQYLLADSDVISMISTGPTFKQTSTHRSKVKINEVRQRLEHEQRFHRGFAAKAVVVKRAAAEQMRRKGALVIIRHN